MSKYAPLEHHLESQRLERVPMTFSEIERVLESALPPSARKHRAWWSNNPTNSVMTYSWLAAGYKTTEVNLESEKVVFVRTSDPTPTPTPTPGRRDATRSGGADGIAPLVGCMRGSAVVAAGVDLSQPADPEWGDDG
jgi:hypothetical protein